MAITTHINTYIDDVEEAYHDAANALNEFKAKVEALKTKYASHVADIAREVGISVPEIEALVPQTKPVIEDAEHDAGVAESAVNQVEQDVDNEEDKTKAKS